MSWTRKTAGQGARAGPRRRDREGGESPAEGAVDTKAQARTHRRAGSPWSSQGRGGDGGRGAVVSIAALAHHHQSLRAVKRGVPWNSHRVLPSPGGDRAPGWGSPTSPSQQRVDCGVSTLTRTPHKCDSPKRPPCCSRQTPGLSSASVGLVCGPLESPPTLCILFQRHSWPRTGAHVFVGSSAALGQGLQGSKWKGALGRIWSQRNSGSNPDGDFLAFRSQRKVLCLSVPQFAHLRNGADGASIPQRWEGP